jgi:hypothetical protein
MNLADDPTLHLPCSEHPDNTMLASPLPIAPKPPYRPGRIGEVVVVDPDLLLTPGMP